MNWHPVCRIDDVPAWGARKVRLGALEIGVFRLRDGRILAVENKCPHKGGPLSEGIVSGDTVICPLHAWRIQLADGQAQSPDVGCARPFPVRLENEQIMIGTEKPVSLASSAATQMNGATVG